MELKKIFIILFLLAITCSCKDVFTSSISCPMYKASNVYVWKMDVNTWAVVHKDHTYEYVDSKDCKVEGNN